MSVYDAAAPASLSPAGRIPSLDGLRALSILMVLWGHGRATFLTGNHSAALHLVDLVLSAHLGVSIFFVISGYLITGILIREHKQTGRIRLGAFYLRRAIRILPPLYVYIGVVALLGEIGAIELKRSDIFKSAFFVWNYFGSGEWFLGHTWSLSIEEQFYLFWPFVLVLCGLQTGKKVAIGLIVASPFIRVCNYLLIPSLKGRIPIMGHTRADMLMFGCMIALLAEDETFLRYLSRLDRMRLPAIAALTLFLIEPFPLERFRGMWELTVGYSLEGVCIAIIVAWCVRHPQQSVARLFNIRAVAFLGTLSYSLYLWQQMFLTPNNRTFTGSFPLNVLCSLIMAMASYYAVELPSLRLRSRFTSDRRPAGPGI